MEGITIEMARPEDAFDLRNVMKRAFDKESRKWLTGEQEEKDYNIEPPGYGSVDRMMYSIHHLHTYKVMRDEDIVGGVILTLTGRSFGRIDRIFIDPSQQGKGIGRKVMNFIEDEHNGVRVWELETSRRQIGNLHFYEKSGYNKVFETEEECCYEKRIHKNMSGGGNGLVREYSDQAHSEWYGANLSNISVSNSNIEKGHYHNCNLSGSVYQNINFRKTMFADLTLEDSTISFVSMGGLRFWHTDLGEDRKSISFTECDLHTSIFEQCDLRDVAIKDSQIEGMTINGIKVRELLDNYEGIKSS
ncbi:MULTISPECIES: GNAT family N-acetyltransferase [Pontibacillus]|uniref:GNAT family N-acetyltransferase n=1 Tax=Pontibacillus chungwhensis TaxID=265426 RepID=A0ABY8UTM6_9BACI|nr:MULTISPECIES: GNAT family N-acetyltransferase [Pontibacillus]MCD5323285.1 GNAT family N-acetyltransferase [Pontibacillus sp. HN14]WIF96668.1 GNAT family N-acetyltransferase [Pontibacillus chungwhensis]